MKQKANQNNAKLVRASIARSFRTDKKGITLIALIITIIVMLILAGVVLNLTIGERGIFSNAQKATEETKFTSAQEKVQLAVASSYAENGSLNDEMLKENLNKIDGIAQKVENVTYDLTVNVDGYDFSITKLGSIICLGRNETDTNNSLNDPADTGKEVALKDGWGTESVSYIKTSDGTEVTSITKVATVYAISVGNGETVPVPHGFYYVGGNLATGVIISDKEEDKYDGKIDKTSYVYARNLKGNQFVWIPCETSEYKKTYWGKQEANYDDTTPKAELAQIEKYGGFYVARYEAGLASNISEFTETQKSTGSNPIYNKSGVPQSKAGLVPWVFIDWTTSKANAESMYNNEYVDSGLITGTQWDVILNKLIEKTSLTKSDMTSSSAWGNYRNTQIDYNGRLAKTYYSSNSWYSQVFGAETKRKDDCI